jgi:hypothetical protein
MAHNPEALMMKAVCASEILVNFYQTTKYNIPEDSHIHTHCCENLKSHLVNKLLVKSVDQGWQCMCHQFIKIDLREIGFGDVDMIHLAQDRDRWQALVNTVMNLQVP